MVLFVYYGTQEVIIQLSDGINLGFFTLTLEIDNGPYVPIFSGITALSLLYAAYASQTLRGALKAVPDGQREAGQALGLSRATIFLRFVMPQMWRHALPGLGNQWLVLLKDTALVYLIGINELMLQTQSIARRTEEPFTWYSIEALIYLAITLVSQYILKRIELRTTRFERSGQ